METLLTHRGTRLFKSGNESAGGVSTRDSGSFNFWLLVVAIVIVTVANVLVILTLFSVMRIGHGMESIEMAGKSLVFSGSVDLDHLYKPDGSIVGFSEQGMSLLGDGAAILIDVNGDMNSWTTATPRLTFSHDAVRVQNAVGAGVISSGAFASASSTSSSADSSDDAPLTVFDSRFPNFGLPVGVRGLQVREIRASRLVGPATRPLRLLSGLRARLEGSEGWRLVGKHAVFSADQRVVVSAGTNASITLDGQVQVQVHSLAWTEGRKPSIDESRTNSPAAFRLCVCAVNRRVFLASGEQSMGAAPCSLRHELCV